MDWLIVFFVVIFALVVIQPVLAQRRIASARGAQIRKLSRDLNARVITLIHRQERVSVLGMAPARYIDIDDAQAVIHAIRSTPKDRPIALVLHTPGGLVLAAMQIARAIKAHPAKVTVFVPVYAMSGGTLIALAADEIVMGDFSVLGPIDPQIAGLPAPSILAAKAQKSVDQVHDLTLVLADIGEKAISQLREGAVELMSGRLGLPLAQDIARKLTSGIWTHDYAITHEKAVELGLPASADLPEGVLELMTLYPQPVRQTASVETARSLAATEDTRAMTWSNWLG